MAKILLVEDDSSLAQLYKTALEVDNHEVIVSIDGQDGIAKLTSDKFDLAILDIVLPNTSGLDILKKIRETESIKSMKVIMLTNYGQQENVKEAFDAGADDVFLKYRVTPTEATEKVRALIDSITIS